MHLLIDASNISWRAHWGAQRLHPSSAGKAYADVHMFLSMIKSYKNMYPKSIMWLVWDKKLDYGVKNPRKDLQEAYKEGRSPDAARDVFTNSDKLTEAVEKIGIRNFYPSHLEADDCIAWLSRKLDRCTIFSADQDMAQLVSPTCDFYSINKKVVIDLSNFAEYYDGMTPQQYVYYKCIMGDPSDNIEGLEGFGKVRSSALAKKWPNVPIEESLKEKVEANYKMICLTEGNFIDELELSRYEEQYEAKIGNVDTDIDAFESALKEMQLHFHLKKLSDWKKLFISAEPEMSELLSKLLSL